MKSLLTLALASVLASSAQAAENLTAETASPGGSIHLSMVHLAEIAAEKGIANIQVADGQTLTNSVQNVAEGKTDIAGTPYILPFLLAKGRGPYSKLGPEKGAELASNLRALYPVTLGIFALYAYDSKGVKGWSDLEGRSIYNGPPRGAAVTNARAVIQLTTGLKEGDGYKGVQVNWGQAVKTITDGSADAVVLPILFPDSRITQALASGSMTVWSVPKEKFESDPFQKYLRAPGSAPFTLPASDATLGEAGVTLVTEDGTFRGLATIGGDIVSKNMSFDLAKALTKAHIDTLDRLKSKAPFARHAGYGIVDVVKSGMCGPNPLKYHAGAVAAWEEAGFKIEDCAKPE
ncbi:C4-dicarboxylate ABC transporter substrate-binding protein [Chromatiales bacterium (ex Bugula neritina AB1)]|nr:C4-dicarboxylate ABC transporter substrate-binding protein [Chromatiales bacterium (ex Bugula neritina AB1)]